MPIDLVFDYLGTRINGPRAGNARIVINWRFVDSKEAAASTLEHGALTCITGKIASDAEAMVTTTRVAFEEVVMQPRTLSDHIQRGEIAIVGNPARVADLITLLDEFEAGFPIVEPLQTQ